MTRTGRVHKVILVMKDGTRYFHLGNATMDECLEQKKRLNEIRERHPTAHVISKTRVEAAGVGSVPISDVARVVIE